jgi:hypothetical protein
VKARELIERAILEPDTLAVLRQAFDQAWEAIKDRYSSELDIAHVRLQLARSALALAAQHPNDVEALTRALLAHMGEHYGEDSDQPVPS